MRRDFQMNSQKVVGWLLVAGSLLFLAGSFSPVSRVYAEATADRKLEIILASGGGWALSQILFSMGAIVIAAGVTLAAYLARDRTISLLLRLSAAVLTAGAVLMTWHAYVRALDPRGFAHGTLPMWDFIVYSLFTQVGLALLGIALVRSGFPRWVGRTATSGAVLFFLLMIIFGDMPPLVYYFLTLLAGIMFVRQERTQPVRVAA
jgi:hypothetical protein